MDTDVLLDINCHMAPTRVELELTEQCNLRCCFCYNSQNPLVSDKAFSIIDALYKQGVPEIVLTGGEPLSHPYFHDILMYCAKRFSKVLIQTNGTLIDDECVGWMKEAGVFSVNISLHGDRDTHERLTLIKGSYDSAYNALIKLVSNDINVASNFVLTSQNIDSFPQTLSMLYKIGLNGMTLTRFTPTGVGAANTHLMISIDQLISVLRYADRFLNNNNTFFILLANSVPYCSLPNDLKHYSEYCHFGASRFYIDINGNVLMCGMSRLKIGNILQESFFDIKCKSDLFRRHICGTDVPASCQKCPFFSSCRGGCRAAAFAISGRFDGFDPYCRMRGETIDD